MEKMSELVLFETKDQVVTLSVLVEQETVWLNRIQMAELFDRDVKTIGKHINNALKEEFILSFDEKPHCIAYWGDARDEENRGKAELICIHSLPENWHKGYGSKMMEVVLEDIRNTAEYREVVLWVFKDNTRAREFYESKGFEPTSISRKTYDTEEMLYTMKIG